MQFRPDVDPTPTIVQVSGVPDQVQKGRSGILPLGPRETRVQCPKCGSPALVQFETGDEKFGAEIPGFACEAGDCGYVGVAIRRTA